MKSEDLKRGSIVRMCFSTYSSKVKEGWTITRRYLVEDYEFVDYIADCVVSSVTDKFFRVIIPHSNSESVRFSKRCFTDTKQSYADARDFKAQIVSI